MSRSVFFWNSGGTVDGNILPERKAQKRCFMFGDFLCSKFRTGGFHMKQITGNKLLVKALKEEGVEYLFGYPGACTIDISDELYKQDEIKIVLPRHEQAPSQQNWQPYNSLKKPGQMRAQSYQTVAHGADTIQFFQLRRSVGGCEKFHGAVIAHAGTADTRVFREVTQLGKELEKIGSRVMGSENHAKVGIIFDWENYWALEYTSGPNRDLRYVDQIEQMYNYFYNKNIAVDMIPIDADFSKYDLVAAPVLYMVKDGVAESLEAYVQAGGTLITTYMSGIVGQSDNVHLGGYPGPLRKMAGVWVEEIDALAPEQRNKIRFADGTEEECRLVCDLMHLEGAEEIAQYESDFYAGMTAVAKNQFGKGTVYYVGTDLSESGLAKVLAMAADSAAIQPVIGEATALEITKRQADGEDLYFIINFKDEEIPLPAVFDGKEDILTGEKVQGGEMLKKYGLRIVSVPRA